VRLPDRLALAGLALALLPACPSERPAGAPDAAPPPVPAARIEPVARVLDEGPVPAPGEVCLEGGQLHATGRSDDAGPSGRAGAILAATLSLARSLPGSSPRTLEGLEVPEVGPRGAATLALARMPGPEGVTAPPCGRAPSLELDPLPEGCPAWTRLGFAREGDAFVGVGAVHGVRNPSLAATSAKGRALALASHARAAVVAEGALSVPPDAPPLSTLESEVAPCGEAVFARVKARVGG
jgi:hypothetical protein